MVGAIAFVHWGEPLALGPDGRGSGFAFVMGIASAALLSIGAGILSVDALLAGAASAERAPSSSH